MADPLPQTAEMGRPCEECGIATATVTLLIDGEPLDVCDACIYWWINHTPSVRPSDPTIDRWA